ncbi:MAG TPA: tetratricopeptide repeat protein, partial [Armatimonadota bacterium]
MPKLTCFAVLCVLGLVLCVLPAFGAAAPIPSAAADKAYAAGKQLYDTSSDALATKELLNFIVAYPADPRIPDASFMLGNIYQRQHDVEKALASYTRVIAKATQPDQAELRAQTHFEMGECYRTSKDYEKAQKSYSFSLQLAKPGSESAIRAQYWQAECLYQLARLEEALKNYRGVIAAGPTHPLAPWSYYSIGMIEQHQGHFTPAITALEQVHTLYKESEVVAEATLLLGFAYRDRASSVTSNEAKKADNAKAVEMFTEVRGSEKATASAKELADIAMADIAFAQQEYAQAEKLYASALEIMSPGNERVEYVRLNRGHALFNQGRYRDAVAEYDRVAHSKSAEMAAEASLWLGNCWFKEAEAGK